MLYVTNAKGHYFEVDMNLDLEKLKSLNCQIHDTLNDMYNHVMDEFGLDYDEVECNEITITSDRKEYDFTGGLHSIKEKDVEKYISEWEC